MEDTTMLDGSQPLFADLTFTIIPTSLSDRVQKQLSEDISTNGGTIMPFDALNGRIEHLTKITHIISATSDFPDYHRALDLFIHVVKPAWVDACLKVGKAKNPRAYSPDPALFMSEVVLCCADIPEGDREAIEGGVIALGGQYTQGLSKMVTHLVALDMNNDRCQLAKSKKLRCAIVLPHWFDDCLKVGRRISERPYTLPNPEILDVQAGAIPPTRTSLQIREASNPEPTHEPSHTTPDAHLEPTRSIKAFEGKKIKLAEDLGLSDGLHCVIQDLIRAGGGEVTSKVDEAQIYVCNYREGADYIKASQENKDVGNLSWLYYLIAHDTWTNPMRRMMHYPRPRDGIPGFKTYKISISSYTGEARVYLENLVKATGAEFTKTFKQDNTHLITAHRQSEKCEAAQEWNVHVVNHLWLEESYARCKEQTLTDCRYNYFPARTNLGEVLGQTELNRDAVEKNFFSKNRKLKSIEAAIQQDNVPESSNLRSRVHSDPVARSSPLAEKTKRTRIVAEVVTPVAPRHIDGKENQTPGTTGSRGAKDRALLKLHNAAPDIAKFEKEMKRKGGVIHGGRREREPEVKDKIKGRESTASKRSIDEVYGEEEATEDELQDVATNNNKRAKKDKKVPIKFRMLVSKKDSWVGNHERECKEREKLRELGVYVNDDHKRVDLLCAPKVVRTKKFVAALASAPILVSTSYLDYAIRTGKLPPPEKHLLKDPAFEKEHGFRLDEALERAKQNKRHLLKNWTIFCTNQVTGGFDTFKEIIQANGGKVHQWEGRTTTINAAKRSIDFSDEEVSQNQEEDEGDVLYLISEPNKKEIPLWVKFRELAKKHDMIPRIVKTEWLLFVAMAQYVHWDPAWELNEEVIKKK
ncbi:hypothetical protein CC78DRAFT_580288 [Lojkania enalia]|uniref:BRCT domain-containing protein n=1 Tax=Lojkania enalia TaxID=147567 RepID=A0A9P4N8F1_9PLEO|nr:hypothetical protein CC78DRAFT_580288 [Didymosphaeria enalia]